MNVENNQGRFVRNLKLIILFEMETNFRNNAGKKEYEQNIDQCITAESHY